MKADCSTAAVRSARPMRRYRWSGYLLATLGGPTQSRTMANLAFQSVIGLQGKVQRSSLFGKAAELSADCTAAALCAFCAGHT